MEELVGAVPGEVERRNAGYDAFECEGVRFAAGDPLLAGGGVFFLGVEEFGAEFGEVPVWFLLDAAAYPAVDEG